MTHLHRCVTRRCGQYFECDGVMVVREDAEGRARPLCAAYYVHHWDQCDACMARERAEDGADAGQAAAERRPWGA